MRTLSMNNIFGIRIAASSEKIVAKYALDILPYLQNAIGHRLSHVQTTQ